MHDITRRRAMQGGAALAVAAAGPAAPFTHSTVRRAAQDLAKQPFREPDTALPGAAGSMSYEQYRGIRFKPERALWRGQDLPFQVQFFPRGFLYRPAVDIHEVRDGQAAPIPYDPDLFDYDDPAVRVPDRLGFAGFRAHAAINRPGEFDEFCVFLGASYFRAVGRGQSYGLSARGLALGTGTPRPEEFPRFRAFWLERPQPGVGTLAIHALLDSPSAAGAFRFALRPGETTTMDVESVLFPRRDITEAGVAPLTSMYEFGPRDHARPDALRPDAGRPDAGRPDAGRPDAGRPDDWRTAVHDSDGLAALTGRDERLWRPLLNPADVQFSAFLDANPRGFGLLQRRREFRDFGDLEVPYERRPSLWVEPIGDWGVGAVDLVEIPTRSEYNDNIVAFWRGREALRAGGEYGFTYRLHWGASAPGPAGGDARLARVAEMRTGAGTAPGTRVFVLDFLGDAVGALAPGARTRVELGSSAGQLGEGYSGPNAETGGWRISLVFDPGAAPSADLRCALRNEQGPLSETWLYRWIA